MNSYNTKTLLITTALAVRVLSIAQGLANTTVQQNEPERALGSDVEFDGFKIEHDHAEYGSQILLVDQIHQNLYSVSFVGHEEYLEMIGSQGWTSSADALINYLSDLNPEFDVTMDEFRCTEAGDYIVYSLASEDEINLDSPELACLFIGQVFTQAAHEIDAIIDAAGSSAQEEVLSMVEDAVQTDAIDERMDAGSQAADHPDDVDSPRVASMRRKVMDFVASPAGVATVTATLGLMAWGVFSLLSPKATSVAEEALA